MVGRRQRAAAIVDRVELDAERRLPRRRCLQVAKGIEIDLTGVAADALLRDGTSITLTLSSPWPCKRVRCTLGDLRRAARDWADAPSEPACALYAAIAAALP